MLTVTCLTNQFLKRAVAIFMIVMIAFTASVADAKAKKKAASMCTAADQKKSGTIKPTSYYIPQFKSFTSKAKKAMNMQGSVIAEGKVWKFNGKKAPRTTSTSECPQVFGMPTTTGAAGRCLIPFVSVAADKKKYPMGTIIEVPEMKGKTFTLPNGKPFKHPGFLIVQDTGQAIKGGGRFDFFTGTANPFKTDFYNEFKLTDKKVCNFSFNAIYSEGSPAKWAEAQAEIQDSLSRVQETKMAQYMGKYYGTGKSSVAATR